MTKAVTDATTASPATRACSCGQLYQAYEIGGHQFWASACPACIAREDEAEKKEKAEGKLFHLGFQRRYAESDFDNLNDPKPSESVIEACRLYAEQIRSEEVPSGRGLYLWGPNGTGKTHLAVAITRHYGHSLFVNTLRLFDELKKSYAEKMPCDVFEAARHVRLLVLDDLGSERPSGWVQERFYALLSTRWDEMLSTVVTSNYSPKELADVIGSRSASRVLGSCLTLHVDGPDHRMFTSAAI